MYIYRQQLSQRHQVPLGNTLEQMLSTTARGTSPFDPVAIDPQKPRRGTGAGCWAAAPALAHATLRPALNPPDPPDDRTSLP